MVVGRKSPYSLFDAKVASFEVRVGQGQARCGAERSAHLAMTAKLHVVQVIVTVGCLFCVHAC